MIKVTIVIISIITFSGCSISSGGFPNRSVNEQADIDELAKLYATSEVIKNYNSKPTNEKRAERNNIVNGRMALVDAHYKVFIRDFVIEKKIADTATDFTVIGLNTAGALITPTSTTQIISGISGALVGAKSSFDKNYYYEQTARALYTAMEAERKKVQIRILKGLKQDIDAYPLTQALIDLDDLYRAGTFIGALQSVQREAGINVSKNQKIIDEIREVVDAVKSDKEIALAIISADIPEARKRILAWYKTLTNPSLDTVAVQGAMISILGNVPVSIQTTGQPDPNKWLGGDPRVTTGLATADQLAKFVAGLNNPLTNQPQQFKGKLISILLKK